MRPELLVNDILRRVALGTRMAYGWCAQNLTNQDSAGGKNCTVLTSMYVNKKGTQVVKLFSLEKALNIHEKRFRIPKIYQFIKSGKYEAFLCLHAFKLAPKMGRSRPATRSQFVECHQVG